MKYRHQLIVISAFLLALSLVLGGCAIHNEMLDAQMQKTVTALNQKDTDTLRRMLPADGMDEESFLSDVEQLYSVWVPVDPSDAKLIQLNVTKSPDQTVTRGVYSVPGNEQYNCFQLIYVEMKDGTSVLNRFDLGRADSSEHSAAGSPLGIIGTVLAVISFAVIIITIIDIARKRPRKYGWYIVLSLFTFFLLVNGVRLTAPVGAIIYWCIRGSLLQKKAAAEAESNYDSELPSADQDLTEEK